MITVKQVLDLAKSWLGFNERNNGHKIIIDIYNKHRPLARGYKVKYSDQWCATFISALFIKLGATDLVGTECSVQRYIDIFKQKGIWDEDGRITPKAGDIICYNWDTKVQPNDGWADHIGIVEKVVGNQIIVIEGNKGESVERRTITIGHGQIRGYAKPKYKYKTEAPKKSNDEIANEVIAGKWSAGIDRRRKLENAGYNYDAIQKLVNLKLTQKKPALDINKVVIEVINGEWGNGKERQKDLEKAGYNYNEVQKKVNEILKVRRFEKGTKVRVKPGARTYDGKKLSSFVFNKTYQIIQVDNDRVVIGTNNLVTAAINKKDLELI